MKKRSLTLVVLLLFVLSIQVRGALYALQISPGLSFSGTTATCSAQITSDYDDDSITVILTLWHGNEIVKTWVGSGKGTLSFSRTCTVSKGERYTLTLDTTVNGTSKGRDTVSSTCK